MNPSTILLPAMFMVTVTACKMEDEEGSAPTTPYPDPRAITEFSLLQAGNYWVYERRQVDSMDVDQGTSVVVDSIFVTEETMEELGVTYTVLRKASNRVVSAAYSLWRDSANCIVNNIHRIQFCSSPLDEVVETTFSGGPNGVQIDVSVGSAMEQLTVPAGSFATYKLTGAVTSYGTFPFQPSWKHPRSYWAPGVGRVMWYDYYAAGDLGYRFELVRYNVQ
jgi:hypothetical protein